MVVLVGSLLLLKITLKRLALRSPGLHEISKKNLRMWDTEPFSTETKILPKLRVTDSKRHG